MSAVTAVKDPVIETWLAAAAALESESPAGATPWFHPLRRDALGRFATGGFPTTRMEDWRYTSVTPIATGSFAPVARAAQAAAPARAPLTTSALKPFDVEGMPGSLLVFVNGWYEPSLSRLSPGPDGVRLFSLAAAAEAHRALIEPHLARPATLRAGAFAALNTAFLRDGACLVVPEGADVTEPVHLLFLNAPSAGGAAIFPRVLVVAGRSSRVSVVESHAGLDGGPVYFSDGVTEIVAGDGATVEHHRVQRESPGAHHVSSTSAVLGRDAVLASHVLTLGGGLTRNDLSVTFEGEGGDVALNGLWVSTGGEHVDNHTVIDHAKPHCSSRELYKGVLDGRARGVFDGKIVVRKDAQKTDAHQFNRNLILSDEALVDTKPQLEINADDVRCSHAATIGQIDPDQLFYLRTRGLGEEEARRFLIQGFVADVVSRVRVPALRETLERLALAPFVAAGGDREVA